MMRHILLIIYTIFLIANVYSQESDNIFSYERSHLSASIVQSGTLDSVTHFEKIVLDGFDSKIPFYHFLNDRTPEKSYAILLHGLGGNKMYWIYPSMPYLQYTKNLTAIKDSLLSLGFNLVIIDAKYHGERTYELGFRDPSDLPPQLSQNMDDADLFYNMIVSTVREVRLIMDYLEQVNKEPDIKFNLVGYSMGGSIALILNSIDSRINSTVACVPPLGRPYSELNGLNWPDELGEKMQRISPLYCATHQQAPVILLMGKTDFFTPAEEANAFFEQLIINDKELKFFDSGHELPDEYINDVIEWITQHNNIRTN